MTFDLADKISQDKHRQKGESRHAAHTRIANALKDSPEHFQHFRSVLSDNRFLPAGRIQAAVGTTRAVTPFNCYVSGTIEDSYVDGAGSIMQRAAEAARTMRMGGGIGYDFSPLRPRGSLIGKLGSTSGGPVPFMEIFDAVCRATASAGERRGAQMGVLRIDHPDIEEFLLAKQNTHNLRGFNISIAVTDEFMQAVVKDDNFNLKFKGRVKRTVKARLLWDAVMRSTYDWAEPGVIFIDRVNEMNNLWYCEKIVATNPCGEQPLPPFGACLLGSVNLAAYIVPGKNAPWEFDYESFVYDVPSYVRALDNVTDRAVYPLYEQEKEALSKRRMGIGVTGLANAIEALGYKYGSGGFRDVQRSLLRTLRNEVYSASVELAREKGAFPLFDANRYCQGKFIQTLPDEQIHNIRTHGIRNSHLLSIAPTGTISLAAGNVSSGIEPVFAYKTARTVIEPEGTNTYEIEDYGVRNFGIYGKTAAKCSANDHLSVLITASQYVDSAVSKTCNVPVDFAWNDFSQIYVDAWSNGCKGCTTYRSGGKREAILTNAASDTHDVDDLENPKACYIDPETGRKECE